MTSDLELDPEEARVLGVLIEKSITTPDHYPLTINALTNGCNQKSNRDPMMSLSESEVQSAVSRLLLHRIAGAVHQAGSRVEKFRHNAQEILGLDKEEVAILAELMMRGPQTPGELRARVKRMANVDSQEFLQRLLNRLIEREYVEAVAPAPGSRAGRFGQRLAPGSHPASAATATMTGPATQAASQVPAAASAGPTLEQRVTQLEEELANLKRDLGV